MVPSDSVNLLTPRNQLLRAVVNFFLCVKSILNKVHAQSKAPHGISNRFI